MTVKKINGFDVPYRSKTFQDQVNKIEQSSGLLRMDGEVTLALPNVIIPPFDFVQNGLIVTVSSQKSLVAPTQGAPYFLAVTSPTTHQTDDLSFQFPKSPSDISANQVIIGYYDGVEWRKPQLLGIAEIYKDINQANIDYKRIGPSSGLLTYLEASNYRTEGGLLTDREGLRQSLEGDLLTPIVATDPDYDRVDRIIYRRPKDSVNRIGTRKFVLGSTFSASFDPLAAIEHYDNSEVISRVKTLVGSNNEAYFLAVEGYGTSFKVVLTKYAENRTTVTLSKTTLTAAATRSDFDCVLDKNNNIILLYISGNSLVAAKLSSVGASISTLVVHSPSTAKVEQVSCYYNKDLDRVFIVSCVFISTGLYKLYFQSVQNGATLGVAVPTMELPLTTSGLVSNPNVFVTDDFDVYISFEQLSTQKIYFMQTSFLGAVKSPSAVISDGTVYGASTLSGSAKNSKVFVTDNKEVRVAFLQDKGSGAFGLSIWKDGSARMLNLIEPSEDFQGFGITFDDITNCLYFLLGSSSKLEFAKLNGDTVEMSGEVASVAQSSVNLVRDAKGSLLHSWSAPLSSTFTSYDPGIDIFALGAQSIVGSLGTILLAANELLVETALVTPKVGDKITISGATNAGNNGDKIILSFEPVSLNIAGDFRKIVCSASFDSPESPTTAKGDFKKPDGNAASFRKSNGDITTRAYRFDVLSSDMLLARLSLPGPIVLNYGESAVGAAPAPTDKLISYGDGVTFDWGATTSGALKITGGLKVLDLVNNISYNMPDGTYPLLENQALYAEFNVTNLNPTLLVADIAVLPFSSPIQILGVRKQNNFVPHMLLSSLDLEVMEPGEVVTVGHDLPDMMRARLGIISDIHFYPYYPVGGPPVPPARLLVQDEDNYPLAITRLDAAIHEIYNNHNQLEIATIGTATNEYTAATMGWSDDNTKFDILVFVNGKFQAQSVDYNPAPPNEWNISKDYAIYDTNILRFSYLIPAGSELVIFQVRTGGSAGFFTAKNKNIPLGTYFKKINFLGSGVTASHGGNGQVNVEINGGPNEGTVIVKTHRNGTGFTLNPGQPVAFDDFGHIVLADASVASLSDFAGVVKEAIAPGEFGSVYKLGDCPDILELSLSALPGDLVYLGTDPGTLSLTPPPGLTDSVIIIGRAEPKTAANPDGTATSLLLNPQGGAGISSSNPIDQILLQDSENNDVYRLAVTNGVLSAQLV